MIETPIVAKAKMIKLAIFDIDGVLTDGILYYADSEQDFKGFHVHDGLGLKLLQKSGVEIAIISSHQSPMLKRRLKDLGIIHVFLGQEKKMPAYEQLLDQTQLTDDQVCYVGDDLPDLALIRRAHLGITVANAPALMKHYADWVTTHPGGSGAVREICEFIMQAQGTFNAMIESFL
jgi:3-deoxy-D-manno-octulosonate 8-phosphate phosphatase (KDO 8-P phosphatase)